MSELRIKLDCILQKIGIQHLIPGGCDEKLHSWVCQLLCVDKVSNLSFQHLNEISSSLDFIVTAEDKQRVYNIISIYEKSIVIKMNATINSY